MGEVTARKNDFRFSIARRSSSTAIADHAGVVDVLARQAEIGSGWPYRSRLEQLQACLLSATSPRSWAASYSSAMPYTSLAAPGERTGGSTSPPFVLWRMATRELSASNKSVPQGHLYIRYVSRAEAASRVRPALAYDCRGAAPEARASDAKLESTSAMHPMRLRLSSPGTSPRAFQMIQGTVPRGSMTVAE